MSEPLSFTKPRIFLIRVKAEPDDAEFCEELCFYAFSCTAREVEIQGGTAVLIQADHVQALIRGYFDEILECASNVDKVAFDK